MIPEKAFETREQQPIPMGVPDAKSARVLARSFYRELREGGFGHNQILAASNEILELVAQDLRARSSAGQPQG